MGKKKKKHLSCNVLSENLFVSWPIQPSQNFGNDLMKPSQTLGILPIANANEQDLVFN